MLNIRLILFDGRIYCFTAVLSFFLSYVLQTLAVISVILERNPELEFNNMVHMDSVSISCSIKVYVLGKSIVVPDTGMSQY